MWIIGSFLFFRVSMTFCWRRHHHLTPSARIIINNSWTEPLGGLRKKCRGSLDLSLIAHTMQHLTVRRADLWRWCVRERISWRDTTHYDIVSCWTIKARLYRTCADGCLWRCCIILMVYYMVYCIYCYRVEYWPLLLYDLWSLISII